MHSISLLLSRRLAILRSSSSSSSAIGRTRNRFSSSVRESFANKASKRLTLDTGNLKLESRGLAGAVRTGKGAGTPGRTTVDLREVGKLAKGLGVAERDVVEAVVSKGGHGSKSSGLLATTEGTGGDEETSLLAVEATRRPDTAGLVPEGLPLGRHVAVTGGDTEEDTVVFEELRGVVKDGDSGILGRSVHLAEDFLRKGLGDLVDVDGGTGLLSTSLLGEGEGLDVAVGGVLLQGEKRLVFIELKYCRLKEAYD